MPRSVRIASVNVNGIRAAVRNGMTGWLDGAGVDILTLQEVRAETTHITELLPGWHIVHDESLSKGRSGVAVLSRIPAAASRIDLGEGVDSRGRWIEADLEVDGETVTVVSAYVHSGEDGTPRQDAKYGFLDAMTERMSRLAAGGALVLVTGDLNVGHRPLDIKNWRGNQKKAGFLPKERAYVDRFLGDEGAQVVGVDGSTGTGLGWVDIGRRHAGEVEVEQAVVSHDAVLEVAVIGRPDARWGERPVAFVVLREGHAAGADELRVHTRGLLAAFKVPDEFHFVAELPHTATGKVRKFDLRAAAVNA